MPYALLSGVGGALIAEKALGALGGNFWAVAGIGTLVTLSGATVTIALQTLFGVIGIGLTLLIFVILGNPSAGAPINRRSCRRSGGRSAERSPTVGHRCVATHRVLRRPWSGSRCRGPGGLDHRRHPGGADRSGGHPPRSSTRRSSTRRPPAGHRVNGRIAAWQSRSLQPSRRPHC